MALPLAHVGHYLWVLYLIPVLVVIGGIVRTMILERRRQSGGEED
jgi:cytochrome c-type biogenesis protein CcmH/NrfF